MRKLSVALLACLLVFGACTEDANEPEDTLPAPTLEPTPTPTDEPFTSIDVEVSDGAVVGGMQRVKVPLNNEVRLSVRSDVADEVHVHGFDVRQDISAGGGILVTFKADVPGVFVVELEERRLHIVELEVR